MLCRFSASLLVICGIVGLARPHNDFSNAAVQNNGASTINQVDLTTTSDLNAPGLPAAMPKPMELPVYHSPMMDARFRAVVERTNAKTKASMAASATEASKVKWGWWYYNNYYAEANYRNNLINEINWYSNNRDNYNNQANYFEWWRNYYNNQYGAVEGQLRNIDGITNDERTALAAAQRERDAATKTAMELTSQRDTLRQQFNVAATERDTNRKAAQASQQRRATSLNTVNSLRQALAKEDAALQRASGTANAAVSKLETAQEELAGKLRATRASIHTRLTDIKTRVRSASDEEKKEAKLLADAKTAFEALKVRREKAVAALKAATQRLKTAKEQAEATSRKMIREALEARSKAADSATVSKRQLTDATNKAEQLEKELAQRREDYKLLLDVHHKEGAALASRLAEMRKELKELQARYRQEQQQRDAAAQELMNRVVSARKSFDDLTAQYQAESMARKFEHQRLNATLTSADARADVAENNTATELGVMKKEADRLTAQLHKAEKEQQAAADALSQLAAKLANQTAAAETAIRVIRAARITAEELFKSKQHEWTEAIKAAEGAVETSRQRQTAMEQALAIDRANREREMQAAQNSATEAAAARARDRATEQKAFNTQSSDLRGSLSVLENQLQSLEDKHAQAQADLESVQRDLANRRKEVDGVNEEQRTLTDMIARLRTRKGELEAFLVQVGGKMEATMGEVSMQESLLKDALDTLEKTAKETGTAEQQHSRLEEAVEAAERRLKDAAKVNAAMGADMERLKAVQASIAKLADAISAANRRAQEADTTKATLETDIAKLTSRKAELEAVVAELQTRIETRVATAGVATGSNDELKQKEAGLRKEATDAVTAAEAKSNTLQEAAKEVRKAMAEKLNKLQADLRAAEEEKSKSQVALTAERAQIEAAAREKLADKIKEDQAAANNATAKALAQAAAQAKAAVNASGNGTANAATAAELAIRELNEVAGRVESLQASMATAAAAKSAAAAAVEAVVAPKPAKPLSGLASNVGPVAPTTYTTTERSITKVLLGDNVATPMGLGVQSSNVADTLDRPVVAPLGPSNGSPLYATRSGEVIGRVVSANSLADLLPSSSEARDPSNSAAELKSKMDEAASHIDSRNKVIIGGGASGETVVVGNGA